MIGSVAVMQQVPVLSALTQLCNERFVNGITTEPFLILYCRDWIVDLPPNAAEMYFAANGGSVGESASANPAITVTSSSSNRTTTPRKVTKVSVQSEVKSTVTSGTIVELGGRTWLPHGLAGI